MTCTDIDEGGLGPYDPLTYAELELDEYRTRFPAATSALSDRQIWDVVSFTEDDMSDEEWVDLFLQASLAAGH